MAHFDAPAPLLPEIIALHSRWRDSQPAIICGEQSLSWRQFGAQINRLANTLLEADLANGARIGVVMENSTEMAIALFGCMAAGCTSVPINLSVNDASLAVLLEDAGITGLIASASQTQRLEHTIQQRGSSLRLLLTTTGAEPTAVAWQLWDMALSPNETAPAVTIDPDQVLNIIYSSGTTGLPKGIEASQRGRRDWAYDLAIALRYHSGARTLITIGLYSNISWVAMLSTVIAGGCLVLQRQFSARGFLDIVARERITHTAMVPVQFQRVLEEQHRASTDVSSMQSMMSCGSPLHQRLKKAIFEQFPCGVIELYGLTEGVITTLDPEHAEGHWSSVGKPLVGTDIKIIGDDDSEVPWGCSGEVVSRGRITMPGYHNRNDANREATWTDPQGRRWLRTGDIGHLDEESFLYIVDRKKDMILSGGQNVYPQDIEALLFNHSAVGDVAVIGAPSESWGETPIALVVLAEAIAAETLKAWCNQQLGRQQRLSDVIFVEELPRNPNGKILKRELREQFSNRSY